MKSKKYTIMFIPDEESESKSYYISSLLVKTIVYITISLIIGMGSFIYYFLPKLSDYNDVKNNNDILYIFLLFMLLLGIQKR